MSHPFLVLFYTLTPTPPPPAKKRKQTNIDIYRTFFKYFVKNKYVPIL